MSSFIQNEEFGVDYDATTIDQDKQVVEIHEPDGNTHICIRVAASSR